MSYFDEMIPPAFEVKLGGKKILLGVLTIGDHAKAARKMREGMVPVGQVLDQLRDVPEDRRDAMLEIAYRDARFGGHVELEDVLRWYRTPEGYLYRLWLAAVKFQPDITLAEIDRLASGLEEAEVRGLDEGLDGMPEGNGQGPPGQMAAAAGIEARQASPGGSCA